MTPPLLRARRLVFAAAAVRSTAVGMMGVMLGLLLARRGLSPEAIGVVIGAGLAGAAAAAALAMGFGDRIGRRRVLVGVALISAAGAIAAAWASGAAALGAIAFAGMFNGMGRDRGASLVIEQAILPSTTSDRARTRTFAWYNVVQDACTALGSLAAGLPEVLEAAGVAPRAAWDAALWTYAGLVAAAGLVSARLPAEVEVPAGRPRARVSPGTRRTLWRISSLFALDSIGGGFLTTSLLALFFRDRFGASEGAIAALFFASRAANAASHVGAAYLSRHLGLVNTMVFTHIPASLLLVAVPYLPSFAVAAAVFLVREALVEMDVPTRQSYVMAVVRPEERTFASGVTHLVRVGAWAVAPSFAGLFMGRLSLAAPLWIGAGIKVVYDLALWRAFRGLKPPEEI